MKTYPIPMVPGPVKAHPAVLEAYRVDYGSADLEKEYVELYTQTETNLKRILNTRSTVVIQSGEGMLALWGALKSCIVARRPRARHRHRHLRARDRRHGGRCGRRGAQGRSAGQRDPFRPVRVRARHFRVQAQDDHGGPLRNPVRNAEPHRRSGTAEKEAWGCRCSTWTPSRASAGRRFCPTIGTSTCAWAAPRSACRPCRTPVFFA